MSDPEYPFLSEGDRHHILAILDRQVARAELSLVHPSFQKLLEHALMLYASTFQGEIDAHQDGTLKNADAYLAVLQNASDIRESIMVAFSKILKSAYGIGDRAAGHLAQTACQEIQNYLITTHPQLRSAMEAGLGG